MRKQQEVQPQAGPGCGRVPTEPPALRSCLQTHVPLCKPPLSSVFQEKKRIARGCFPKDRERSSSFLSVSCSHCISSGLRRTSQRLVFNLLEDGSRGNAILSCGEF